MGGPTKIKYSCSTKSKEKLTLWNVGTEAETVEIVFTNFSKFTVKSKQLCGVNTCFGKFSNSCQKT